MAAGSALVERNTPPRNSSMRSQTVPTPSPDSHRGDASKNCWGGKIGTNAAPKHAAPDKPTAPLPPSTTAPKHAKPDPDATKPLQFTEIPAGGMYTVVSGDTLFGIATAHGIESWEILAERNRVTVPNPNLIYPGQRLSLR
jgi:LysM repeat protein